MVPNRHKNAAPLLREVWNELRVGHMAASSSEQLEAYCNPSDDPLMWNQGSKDYLQMIDI